MYVCMYVCMYICLFVCLYFSVDVMRALHKPDCVYMLSTEESISLEMEGSFCLFHFKRH